MKKVFSLEKFIASCIKDGDGTCATEVIERHPWALECDYLTRREMGAIGHTTREDWMTELPDRAPLSPHSENATSQATALAGNPLYGDRSVGAVVKIQGIPCRIKSRKWCRGCILSGAPTYLCFKYACTPYDRDDAKDVSFVQIKRW